MSVAATAYRSTGRTLCGSSVTTGFLAGPPSIPLSPSGYPPSAAAHGEPSLSTRIPIFPNKFDFNYTYF